MYMTKKLLIAGSALALICSCNSMENPLLKESSAPFGAPEFDKIKNEHYLPAFEAGIAEAKAEIDAIVANEEEPSFENTIEAMEYSGETLDRVAGIFYNLMEANTNDAMQETAEQHFLTGEQVFSRLTETVGLPGRDSGGEESLFVQRNLELQGFVDGLTAAAGNR